MDRWTRNRVQRDRDLADIAEWYLQGDSIYVIARKLGERYETTLNPATVSKELKRVREQWRESALQNFDTRKSQELARLDAVERQAWAEWFRSREDKTHQSQEEYSRPSLAKGADGKTFKSTKMIARVEKRDGNPLFLQTILTCIQKRCAILGLDAPQKITATDITGTQGYGLTEITTDELLELARKFDVPVDESLQKAEPPAQNPD